VKDAQYSHLPGLDNRRSFFYLEKNMIKWKEAKKAIKVSLGEELVKIGFVNPAYLMYRYREDFIDVILCYYNNYQPRGIRIKNNFKTWDSIFRGRVNLNQRELSIELQDTFEEQVKLIKVLTPQILGYVNEWFSNFADINSAIKAVENIESYDDTRSIMLAGKGSPVYNQLLMDLKGLLKKDIV